MIKKIKQKIDEYGFDDHKIIEVHSNENQLYLLKNGVESKRTVESHYYEITVYADHKSGSDKLRGEYTFVYKPTTDLKHFLEQAKLACTLVKNRYYSLLDSTRVSDVQVFDPRLSKPEEIGERLADTICKNSNDSHVYLSSAELYLTKSEVTLITSTGIEACKKKGFIEIDITLIGHKAKEEQELNFQIERRSIDDLCLERRLREYNEYTRDMLNVQVPKSGTATVAFPATDIYELLSPIIFHSSGRAKDRAISRFTLNEKIIDEATNSLTMRSSGILPYGIYTDPFDDDGIPGQEHTIIDAGVFSKYCTTKRFADYLGVEPTGDFKNLVIAPIIKSAFDPNDYYEIIQFSDLSPDPITGDLVAEIRFGYHVLNGKKTPIKGGSVGGNIFDALKHIHFTNDSVFEGQYLGPKSIVLKELSISGQ
ncbi:hypothetical protein KAS45_03325 [candidate division WOR-3 bacterium]|nr:hypothetical protein [candidate division WOR-3 bacterium]